MFNHSKCDRPCASNRAFKSTVESVAVFVLGTVLFAHLTIGNDSVAHLATGGIQLAQTNNIEMRSEDLYVSARKIEVNYRFYNKSSDDLRTLVAFPMPALHPVHESSDYNLPTDKPVNFLDFKTWVDGTQVAADVEQRAFAMGVDRTTLLKTNGIPFSPYLKRTRDALDKLAPAIGEDFLQMGIIRKDRYDIGKGLETHLHPRWSLHTTYFWDQVFRAQSEVAVKHTYQPSVGASAESMVGMEGVGAQIDPEMKKRYCIESSFINAVRRARKQTRKGYRIHIMEQNIEYVLSTGSNWAGPIKDFRLVVDKGEARNLVSFCGQNVRKISPTQFETRKTDYWPRKELHVLILKSVEVPE